MANTLIVGCGYVGTALASQLAGLGHRVVGWRRSSASVDGATIVHADVATPEGLPAIPTSLEYVFYMVGAVETSDAAYENAYVRGVRNVIQALKKQSASLRRFVFVSSTGVYAQRNGEWVDETSSTTPTRFTGQRLLEGEAIVRSSQLPYTIVRLAGIYGPNRTRIIDSVRDGSAQCPERPAYLNLIHRDDCVGCLRHMITLPNADDVYLGVDHEPTDRGTILRWVAEQLGRPAPPIGPAPPREGGNKRCSNARLLNSGYVYQYASFREGYRTLL